MTAVIAEHDVTVYRGDVREQLALLPGGSVQCCVTSPPYYGLRDYGVDGQLGLESSPAEYVAAMVGVFREVRRVLADDGVLWLNIGDSYASGEIGRHDYADNTKIKAAAQNGRSYSTTRTGLAPKNLLGVPWRVAFALQEDGWTLRNDVIWWKPNAMPESVTDRLSTRYEHVFLFSKSRRYWFGLDAVREPHTAPLHAPGNRGEPTVAEIRGAHVSKGMSGHYAEPDRVWGASGGRNPGDVWAIPTAPFPGAHFACMPPELARRCILAGTPEQATVIDPFAGSGTTLMVARQLNRKAIGIELNPAYIDIIRQRIGQTPLDFAASA